MSTISLGSRQMQLLQNSSLVREAALNVNTARISQDQPYGDLTITLYYALDSPSGIHNLVVTAGGELLKPPSPQ